MKNSHEGISHKFGGPHALAARLKKSTAKSGKALTSIDVPRSKSNWEFGANTRVDLKVVVGREYDKGLVLPNGKLVAWKSMDVHHQAVAKVLEGHGLLPSGEFADYARVVFTADQGIAEVYSNFRREDSDLPLKTNDHYVAMVKKALKRNKMDSLYDVVYGE